MAGNKLLTWWPWENLVPLPALTEVKLLYQFTEISCYMNIFKLGF